MSAARLRRRCGPVFIMHKRSTLIAISSLLVCSMALASIAVSQARPGKHRGHGGALPSMGREPKPSIFGIDTGTYDSIPSHYAKDIPTARRLGARWDRIGLGSATGAGDFATADYFIRRARQHKMGVILTLGGIARACSLRPIPSTVRACPPTTAADLSAYRAYLQRVLLRYRHVVTYYESWIEANNHGKWQPAADPAAYAALLKSDYTVFQAVNSRYHLHLKLLFGSLISFGTAPHSHGSLAVLPFAQRVLEDLHGQRPFDGITLHAYRFPAGKAGPDRPECDYVGGVAVKQGHDTPNCPTPNWRLLTWPQELQAYEQEFSNHGYGDLPLWMTEFGWPGAAQPDAPTVADDTTQARYLREAYRDLLGLPFVQGALWFNLRDYRPGVKTPDPASFYHYGLLNYGYSEKSAAADFKALARANPGR